MKKKAMSNKGNNDSSEGGYIKQNQEKPTG